MDDFRTHSKNFDFLNIILTGASFGIFSVVGSAWKDFIQTIVEQFSNSEQKSIFESFIFLLTINVLGGIFLGVAFCVHKCIRRTKKSVTNRPYIPNTES